MELYNLELEQYLLSGIIRHSESFAEIDGYITEQDFHMPLHRTIFGVIRQTLHKAEKLDKILIAEKIERYSLSFEDKIASVLEYLNNITLIQVKASAIKSTAEALKVFTLRRDLSAMGLSIDHIAHNSVSSSINELIAQTDEIYNQPISMWNLGKDEPSNISDGLEKRLEELAKNPEENIGFAGPHNLINQMYGSLLRPSNITTICSRSGQGKTTFMTDYCFKVSESLNIPTVHFDNGEMSKEELQMRMVASLTGVSFYEIETGKYATDPEKIKQVKEAVNKIKKQRFYYHNVAGKTVEEIISTLRRFYLSKIGRDKPMIFCFDYIKSTSEVTSVTKAEWEAVGKMVTKFKDFISSEIKVPMITAVQSNRIGIATNKASQFVIDDESIFSGGDRTVFFSSHAFILRKKTFDELQLENEKFGTHKLINVKARHLGKDVERALKLVQMPDGKKRNNYVNLEIKNFHVTQKGDLVDMVRQIGNLDIQQAKEELDLF